MCLAVPGEIIQITNQGGARQGRVSFGGVIRGVDLSFVPEAVTGDYVIVHVGVALSVLDRDQAEEVLGYFKEMAP